MSHTAIGKGVCVADHNIASLPKNPVIGPASQLMPQFEFICTSCGKSLEDIRKESSSPRRSRSPRKETPPPAPAPESQPTTSGPSRAWPETKS